MQQKNEKNVKYTIHALRRARERHLWKYVSKEKFFYDAVFNGTDRAKLGECVYIYKIKDDITFIITMLRI